MYFVSITVSFNVCEVDFYFCQLAYFANYIRRISHCLLAILLAILVSVKYAIVCCKNLKTLLFNVFHHFDFSCFMSC